MLRGDIDNNVPPRILVHVSALWDRTPGLKRVLGFLLTDDTTFTLRPEALSYFNLWRDRGVVMELFHYSDDGWNGSELYEELDEGHHHPFNRLYEFYGMENLSSYLAFNSDVQFVVDPIHPLAFGSKSLGDM